MLYSREQLEDFSKNTSDNINQLDEEHEDQNEEEDDTEIRPKEESDDESAHQPANVIFRKLLKELMRAIVGKILHQSP